MKRDAANAVGIVLLGIFVASLIFFTSRKVPDGKSNSRSSRTFIETEAGFRSVFSKDVDGSIYWNGGGVEHRITDIALENFEPLQDPYDRDTIDAFKTIDGAYVIGKFDGKNNTQIFHAPYYPELGFVHDSSGNLYWISDVHRLGTDDAARAHRLSTVDPSNFEVLYSDWYGSYFKTKDGVYVVSESYEPILFGFGFRTYDVVIKHIPDIEVTSLELIKDHYFKDAHQVFLGFKPIEGADPQTFEVLDYCAHSEQSSAYYSRDISHVYCGEQVLRGMDPNTFIILGCRGTEMGSACYGTDRKNAVAFGTKILASADPVTFTMANGMCAQDKNNFYAWGEVVSPDRCQQNE